jgi:hypothetical protein
MNEIFSHIVRLRPMTLALARLGICRRGVRWHRFFVSLGDGLKPHFVLWILDCTATKGA